MILLCDGCGKKANFTQCSDFGYKCTCPCHRKAK